MIGNQTELESLRGGEHVKLILQERDNNREEVKKLAAATDRAKTATCMHAVFVPDSVGVDEG